MEKDIKSLTFKIGEETRPIKLNKSNYKDNLLSNQINKALVLIDDFFPRNISDEVLNDSKDYPINKTISFLGDRGTGKSSCLESLVNILKEERKDIYVLDTIEPAFFDKHRNILELIIGTMFRIYENWEEEQQDAKRHNQLVELSYAFQNVKRDLQYLESESCVEDSEIEDLQGLASSIGLSTSIKGLVNEFLSVEKKNYLLVPIDDIDLNANLAYEMAEQIRKYLIMDKVVVCIAGKSEQLSNSIKQSYIRLYEPLLNHKQVTIEEISAMTEAYMVKFLPIRSRIYMPTQEDYADSSLVIEDRTGENKKFDSVKLALLDLIFKKTRFLFYNSKGQTSLIVPNSLRELRALMLMLYMMPDYHKDGSAEEQILNRENKNAFLNYFFNTWTTYLNLDNRNLANMLIQEKEPSMFNHLVINELKRIYGLKETLSNPSVTDWSILMNDSCMNYNLSIGDVTVVMDYINNTRTDIETRRLLFFIKSLYSIRLYQYYDELTDSLHIEGIKDKKSPELKNNVLQDIPNLLQLIGGSYYTISGEQVIRPERNPDRTREKGLLDGDKLKQLINEIPEEVQDEADKKRLQLAEFLMLISSHYFYIKSPGSVNEEKNASYRERSEVYYTRNLGNVGNIWYDVTAPFFNLIDIEQTYKRFSNSIFDTACKCSDSLYNQMMEECNNKNGNNNQEEDNPKNEIEKKHSYLSAVTIRNMEICEDLFQNMLANRDKCDAPSLVKQMQAFYRGIASYSIQTYDYDNGHRYEITFLPFKILSNFLKGVSDDDLAVFFKKPVVNQYQDEFHFLKKEEMTFAQAWKSIPKKYKLEDSEPYYRDTFHPEPRIKYSRKVWVENLRKMIDAGKLKLIH